MTVGFLGGDRRMEIAADFLKRAGHDVRVAREGVPEASFFAGLDLLVLPYPATRDGVHIASTALPFSRVPLAKRTALFGGRLPLLWREGRVSFEAEDDEPFLLKNAYLTAAAGVCTALRASERAFLGVKAAVLGYGRIGKATAKMLRAMGADVCVYVRRAAAKEEAEGAGFSARLLSDVSALSEEIVFGTVPAPAEGIARLSAKEGALIYDLGGGLPTAFPTRSGKSALTLPLRGAPGVFAPRAAGEVYGECVLDALSRLEGGGAQ